MEIHQGVVTLTAVVSCILTVIGFVIKVNKDRNAAIEALKQDHAKALAELDKDNAQARARIWARIDEIKEAHKKEIDAIKEEHKKDLDLLRSFMAEHYVDSKYCSLLHKKTDDAILEIKDNFKQVFAKLDELSQKLFSGQAKG
jgi:hypothetical protein